MRGASRPRSHNTLWFTLSAGHVPSKSQFGFYLLILLFCIQHSMFPGVCLSVHVLSYFRLLPKPNLLSGWVVMSYFLSLLFHLTAASLWICVFSCCEFRRLKGKRWLGKHARSCSSSPTSCTCSPLPPPRPVPSCPCRLSFPGSFYSSL